MGSKLKSFIGMAFVSIIWTSGFSEIINVLEVVGPFTLIFLRFFIAFLGLLVFQKILGIKEKIEDEDKTKLVINGLIGSIFYFAISNLTVMYLPTVDSAVISSMQLILMLWAESMFLNKMITPKRCFYVVMATIGGILLMRTVYLSTSVLVAYMLMLIATCFWVCYNIIQISVLKKYKASTVIRYQSFYSLFFILPLILIDNNNFSAINGTHIYSFLYLGLMGIAVGYTINSYALKNIGPTNTSLLLIFQPVILLFSDLIFKARLFTLSDNVGIVLIAIAVLFMVIDMRKKNMYMDEGGFSDEYKI